MISYYHEAWLPLLYNYIGKAKCEWSCDIYFKENLILE